MPPSRDFGRNNGSPPSRGRSFGGRGGRGGGPPPGGRSFGENQRNPYPSQKQDGGFGGRGRPSHGPSNSRGGFRGGRGGRGGGPPRPVANGSNDIPIGNRRDFGDRQPARAEDRPPRQDLDRIDNRDSRPVSRPQTARYAPPPSYDNNKRTSFDDSRGNADRGFGRDSRADQGRNNRDNSRHFEQREQRIHDRHEQQGHDSYPPSTRESRNEFRRPDYRDSVRDVPPRNDDRRDPDINDRGSSNFSRGNTSFGRDTQPPRHIDTSRSQDSRDCQDRFSPRDAAPSSRRDTRTPTEDRAPPRREYSSFDDRAPARRDDRHQPTNYDDRRHPSNRDHSSPSDKVVPIGKDARDLTKLRDVAPLKRILEDRLPRSETPSRRTYENDRSQTPRDTRDNRDIRPRDIDPPGRHDRRDDDVRDKDRSDRTLRDDQIRRALYSTSNDSTRSKDSTAPARGDDSTVSKREIQRRDSSPLKSNRPASSIPTINDTKESKENNAKSLEPGEVISENGPSAKVKREEPRYSDDRRRPSPPRRRPRSPSPARRDDRDPKKHRSESESRPTSSRETRDRDLREDRDSKYNSRPDSQASNGKPSQPRETTNPDNKHAVNGASPPKTAKSEEDEAARKYNEYMLKQEEIRLRRLLDIQKGNKNTPRRR